MSAEYVVRFQARAGIIDWEADKLRQSSLDPGLARVLHVAMRLEDDTSITVQQGRSLGVDRDVDIAEFLPVWRLEEAEHAKALRCLLDGRRYDPPTPVATAIARRRNLVAAVPIQVAHLFPQTTFVFCVLGAASEYLATAIYAELAKRADDPVVQHLLRSVARQEARHFAFFLAAARERGRAMGKATGAVARRATRSVWTPIGVSTLGVERWFDLFAEWLNDDTFRERILMMDRVVDSIPHLANLRLMARFLEQPRTGSPSAP